MVSIREEEEEKEEEEKKKRRQLRPKNMLCHKRNTQNNIGILIMGSETYFDRNCYIGHILTRTLKIKRQAQVVKDADNLDPLGFC